jgi:hypothetical protein
MHVLRTIVDEWRAELLVAAVLVGGLIGHTLGL